MEKTPHSYNWEQRDPKEINKQLSARDRVFVFRNNEGQIFEDHSYGFESIAAYEEDLKLIEGIVMKRIGRLAELKSSLAGHVAPSMEAGDSSLDSFGQQIAFAQRQVDFWRNAKTHTAWLYSEAIRRDGAENKALGELTDTTEH